MNSIPMWDMLSRMEPGTNVKAHAREQAKHWRGRMKDIEKWVERQCANITKPMVYQAAEKASQFQAEAERWDELAKCVRKVEGKWVIV